MTLEVVYLCCFGFGLILSVYSFLSGAIDGGTTAADRRTKGTNARSSMRKVDTHGKEVADATPAFKGNFAAIMAFVAAFGATGFILTHVYQVAAAFTVSTAIALGIGAASLMNVFLQKARSARSESVAVTKLVGTVGRLSLPIRANGVGEIIFSDRGVIRTAAARSHDGLPIDKDAEVMITSLENGVAFVRRLEELLPDVERAFRRLKPAPTEDVSRRIRSTM